MRGFRALILAALCVGTPAAAWAQDSVYDPYEGLNRRLYGVHDSLDQAVFEPVAKGYRAATNRPVRSGVRNFLRNLGAPATFANDVLQGEIKRAGVTAARFGINTTIGVLGVFDPADDIGLERHSEDFGQTLAVWGVPAGPYFFVPALGPTTLRDGAGQIIDIAFNPLTWAEFEGEDAFSGARGVLTAVSARESVIETVEDIRQTSLDPYVTYRSTYGLFRTAAIRNGPADVQDLPDFEAVPEDVEAAPPSIDAPADVTPELEPSSPEEPGASRVTSATNPIQFSSAY